MRIQVTSYIVKCNRNYGTDPKLLFFEQSASTHKRAYFNQLPPPVANTCPVIPAALEGCPVPQGWDFQGGALVACKTTKQVQRGLQKTVGQDASQYFKLFLNVTMLHMLTNK